MKTKQLFTLALVGIMSTCLATVSWAASSQVKMITQKPEMKMTTPIPENITTPAKVETADRHPGVLRRYSHRQHQRCRL